MHLTLKKRRKLVRLLIAVTETLKILGEYLKNRPQSHFVFTTLEE